MPDSCQASVLGRLPGTPAQFALQESSTELRTVKGFDAYFLSLFASTVLNPADQDEWSEKGKKLAQRFSKNLRGKPVYLSCSINGDPAMCDLILQEVEQKLLEFQKKNPDLF